MKNYEIYYDRKSKVWWAFWKDKGGHQLGDAVNAPSKELALIYLGMEFRGVSDGD